ncbi:hypothetical protein [Streptomyces sp. AK02-01A]|uniref:hypothetical protein n=1 Tax=Streptomyces sp. AK02-01A TaxID=3028648 RepID=UPI0029B9D40E|nr:hypothetical protein [Streptomyces sp. AK02-01A]MDX3851778.1 hypothetical protein [Streptomyces sp. AK02-01A]
MAVPRASYTSSLAQEASASAAADGFHRGLLIAALFTVVNVVVTLASPRLTPDEKQIAAAAAA